MTTDGRRGVFDRYLKTIGNSERPAKPTEADLASAGITVEYVHADGSPVERDKPGQDEGR